MTQQTETFSQTVQRLLDKYSTDGGPYAVESFHHSAWHLQSPRFATREAAWGWIKEAWPGVGCIGDQRVVTAPEAR